MRRDTFRALPVATLLLATALVVAGCSAAADDSPGVASIDDAATPTADGDEATAAPEDPEEAWAAYEDCMAEEGIEISVESVESDEGVDRLEVPEDELETESDPQGDPQGPEDFDEEEFAEAEKKCGPLLGAVHGFLDLDPEQQAGMEDAAIAFEACMEEQGIEMPEPATDEGEVEVHEKAETDPQEPEDPEDFAEEYEEAVRQCDHIWDQVEDLFPDEEDGR